MTLFFSVWYNISTSTQRVGTFKKGECRVKEKLKKILLFVLNPRLLLCIGIAWMITNGWSYVVLAVGTWLRIGWMIAVGSTYMALLWFPFTPEKILTGIIALFLLKRIFPRDERTLAILNDFHARSVEKHRERKQRRMEKKEEKKAKEK